MESGESRGPQPTTRKQLRLDHLGHGEAGRSDDEENLTNVIVVSSSESYMPNGPEDLQERVLIAYMFTENR